MEFQKGERVFLNFETGGVERAEQNPEPAPGLPAIPAFDFVGDILERDTTSTPPVAPSSTPNATGFPAHRKRTPRVSAFKQRRAASEQQAVPAPKAQDAASLHSAPPPRARFDPDDERSAIDAENQRRLDMMSDAEIEEERRELLANLDPALITQRLFEANMDDGSNEQQQWPEDKVETSEPAAPAQEMKASTSKKVSFATEEDEEEATISHAPESTTPSHTHAEEATGSLHFPPTPQPPDLDPNDPNFLENMHAKYFPSLPYNPSTVEWMKPIDPTDKSSPYHPSQTALNASELRFDFKGALLAPSTARDLPTTMGLHHHAAAPEAAGYTIPELAATARSAVPAQRCMAYQTLGRILFRLGRGEFGAEKPAQHTDAPARVASLPDEDGEAEDDSDADDHDVAHYMAVGLWKCIEDGRVVETLTEEAAREKGHLTARTFAQEALWNWRRGGGRRRFAV
ncbi:uncharacterized protein M421DRAFT_62155 [Didymella exigua CBS 183.55]|uniref:Transcription factor Rba50 n=1 Tax=Didymella exigua CBS 183.55 TaxID=1150837 RepID=A0A6A5RP31_9PLEO|nr:uncharacterized protein M421DRAFT_62155 [Didymella exigua CBS 183.55]KAF1928908.1 hypothetical protein M421DRAFT_62155 [Didymella exigua CBS 183.55]